MSGGSKKKYKQFEIKNVEDACLVMMELLTNVERNLHKYKEYASEVDELLNKYLDSKVIPAKEYEDINDKLLFRQHELLRFIADRQSSSFSYIDFRDFLMKKGYLKEELDKNINEILGYFLDIRNWSFHNPQSLLVAAREASERQVPEELKGLVQIKPQLNPVYIPKVVTYETLYLASLLIHCQNRIEKYEIVLDAMKRDYEVLYKEATKDMVIIGMKDVVYVERDIHEQLLDMNSDITQISMAIQKSKYDGSDEAYKTWTLK